MFTGLKQWSRGALDALMGIRASLADIRASLADVYEALSQLTTVVQENAPDAGTVGELAQRLDDLERSRGVWEGEMAGLMHEIGAEKRAARSSEERTRKMVQKLDAARDDEEGAGGDEAESEAFERWRQLSLVDAEGGGGGGVPPLHNGVESQPQTREDLRRQKLGY